MDWTSILSSFGGGGGGGGGYGSGPSAASVGDVSAGITNNAGFAVTGSGTTKQTNDQTAPTIQSKNPAASDASGLLGGGSGSSPTILYVALGVVGLVAIAAVLGARH